MATAKKLKPVTTFDVELTLNRSEARALYDLMGRMSQDNLREMLGYTPTNEDGRTELYLADNLYKVLLPVFE